MYEKDEVLSKIQEKVARAELGSNYEYDSDPKSYSSDSDSD